MELLSEYPSYNLTAVSRKTFEAVVPVTASHDAFIVSGYRKTAGARRNRLIQGFTKLPLVSSCSCS